MDSFRGVACLPRDLQIIILEQGRDGLQVADWLDGATGGGQALSLEGAEPASGCVVFQRPAQPTAAHRIPPQPTEAHLPRFLWVSLFGPGAAFGAVLEAQEAPRRSPRDMLPLAKEQPKHRPSHLPLGLNHSDVLFPILILTQLNQSLR